MKFAHLADCHIGGWREPELNRLSIESFRHAIDKCIESNVGFILIAGDLFNTAIPNIDFLKETAEILEKLRQYDISVYVIAGSHDFSPSGKTMLDVLEKSGLIENVTKFQDDKLQFTLDKTNTKITGILGKKGSLDRLDYEKLDKTNLESESGFKIFMFHTGIKELLPKNIQQMEALTLDQLPKNFNYYAGGHIHYIFSRKMLDNSVIAYPGALFPNNFAELEEFKCGGFYIIDDKLNLEHIKIKLKETLSLTIEATDKTPQETQQEIIKQLETNDIKNKIVTIRIKGTLISGKPSDINFKEITEKTKEAYIFLKNTNKLTTKEFEEIEVETGNITEVENKIVEEHLGQIKADFLKTLPEAELVKELMEVLNQEKVEGERNLDFEDKILKEIVGTFKISDKWK